MHHSGELVKKRWVSRGLAMPLVLVTLITLGGCAALRSTGLTGARPTTITVGDFVANGPLPVVDEASASGAPVIVEEITAPIDASGLGSRPVRRAAQPGDRIIVDSLVGQVNGRPIFAEDFFVEIDERVLRARDELTPTAFQDFLRTIIQQRLRFVVRNELLLAEAESELKPEQARGLFAWLKDVRQGKIAESGGTQTGAETRLSDEGLSLEEYVALQKDLALLNNLFQTRIETRVVVSWRDIQRGFTRAQNELNTPGSIVLARMAFRGDAGPARAQDALDRIAAGASFVDLAAELGMPPSFLATEYELDDAGRPVGAIQEFQDAVAGLTAGDTSRPITRVTPGRAGAPESSTTYLLHVVQYTPPVERSLYDHDVQRALREQILGIRRQAEEDRYLQQLAQRVVHSELNDMGDRLYDVGRQRYARKR
ncbi:MAG: hypothetical protein KDA25_04650 [Phycisphaerales bacterium]|nr:hypothetical protein [Phycisphaerales bacterium]